MSWIDGIVSAIKLPPKIMAGLALSSGFLVLARAEWIDQCGLAAFMDVARSYIAMVFIVSSSILLIEGGTLLWKQIAKGRSKSRALKRIATGIRDLDPAELLLLREFSIQGQSTVKMPMDQPVVAGLIQKGIIWQVGKFGEHAAGGLVFPFRLHEEAAKLITANMLGLPENPSKDDMSRLAAERPYYMKSIEEEERMRHVPW